MEDTGGEPPNNTPAQNDNNVPARPARVSNRLAFKLTIARPWLQIWIISLVCLCCPGAYNALTSVGGLGQFDQTVTANATAAVFAMTAITALFVVGPLFDRLGPRVCVLLGGWTYALHVGSLWYLNSTGKSAFVIVSGLLLGVGASFLWVAQGAIMTTYVPEHQRGRAIALFWIFFNFGGSLMSLLTFAFNYNSTSQHVSNTTYIIIMVDMLLGWLLGLFACPPSCMREVQSMQEVQSMREVQPQPPKKKKDWRQTLQLTLRIMSDWKVLCMLPLFFSANVFYPYQHNVVNGQNFNIRTRSLNGALYWNAQMLGGLFIGLILDSGTNRPRRARVGWAVLFVSGIIIWGSGYIFQKRSNAFHKWADQTSMPPEVRYIDFTQPHMYMGPMILYMFYGVYDAFWQAFCYWLMGAQSNSPVVTAILVGAYKTFQSIGGAMAWRLNAVGTPAMSQFTMNFSLCIISLVIALPTVLAIKLNSTEDDYEDAKVDDGLEMKDMGES